jgi:hypothetical protein
MGGRHGLLITYVDQVTSLTTRLDGRLGSGATPLESASRGPAAKAARDSVADAVYAEQIAGVFRQMPIALMVNLVNAGLVAIVLT